MSYLNTGHTTNNIFEGFFDFFQKEKTFRPRKKFESGTLRFNLHTAAQASLNSGINLKEAVKLPHGESQNDWVAVHVVDFFNRINLIYGTVCDYCTEKSCPKMSGGPKFEYLWQDGIQYKKPTPLSAPRYISLLMDWIESQINDERTFPTSTDSPFPRNFVNQICKKILTRLFRVFVHVYIHHFDRIVALGAEAHVNTCYKHFYYFTNEFRLVPAKELEPLVVMTDKLLNTSFESTNRCINISAPIQQQQIIFEDCSGINPPSTLMGSKMSMSPNSDVNTLNTEFNNISLAPTTNSSTSHHGGNNNHMQNQNMIKVTLIEDN